MDDDKFNDQLVKEVAQSILDMDAANPDWFLEEVLKIQKLSLELELARHNAEKWDGTREQRKDKYDSRNISKPTMNAPAPLKSCLKKKKTAPTVDTRAEERPPASGPEVESATVEPPTDSTRELVMQLALEVGSLSEQVGDLWDFFTKGLNMAGDRMDELKQVNMELGKALVEQKQKNEDLVKRVAAMEAWVKAQKET